MDHAPSLGIDFMAEKAIDLLCSKDASPEQISLARSVLTEAKRMKHGFCTPDDVRAAFERLASATGGR